MSVLDTIDEADRLQALAPYHALGLEPEAEFDRITALAARLFRVPVALVTLVGAEEQFFKSHHGTDVCRSPRGVAFCQHALRLPEGELLVVPDASADARFAANPLVTGPLHVRFYAGAPLRASGGEILGTLCLIDMVPRAALTAEERATLLDLAAVAMETFRLRLVNRRAEEAAAERRRAEEALQHTEGRFQRMADQCPGMIFQFVLRPNRRFSFPFVGGGCHDLFGVEARRIYEHPLLVTHALLPGDRLRAIRAVLRSARTLRPWQWEGRLRSRDGTVRWVQGASRPERLPDGSTLWNGMLLDITARKAAENEAARVQAVLDESRALTQAVIDGTDDAVFLKDRESRYRLINPAGAALMGRPAHEIIGCDDAAFFEPEDARRIRARDLQVLETGHSSTHEDTDTIAGVSRVFLTTKSPFRDAAGNLVGVIGISRDTTAQHQAAEALRQAKEEAEKANDAKSSFLSRMSHELRTPLNAILGFGQLLEISDLTTHQNESVEHILRAGRHLLHLIDEVLAISKIEAGRMRLSLEPVSLVEVACECLSLVGQSARERGVVCEDLLLTDCQGCDVHVQADRQRLRQVLLNLLSNAVKYNRAGGRVRLDCRELPAGGRVRIAVSDTGPGLTAEEIGRLFTPFERLGAERGATEGTGLGLALSKSLVEAMEGHIGAEGVPGEGSVFWIELPLADRPAQERDGDRRPSDASARLAEGCAGTVLYIEDNLSNLRLIESLFGYARNLALLSAEQGALGIEIARARVPDLILLDLHLPDMPGWEVLAQLRADAVTCNIPVVVISADATPHRIERLRQAGAQDYLAKPIDVRELLRVLRGHLPAGPLEAAGAGI